MQGKTHVLIGATASIFLIHKFGYEANMITTAAAAIGSLIPDIDHPKSTINQKLLLINTKIGKVLAYAGSGAFLLYKNLGERSSILTFIGILLIAIGFSHHRGFTHSVLGVCGISLLVFMICKNIGMHNIWISFIIGMVSHLVADFFTTGGIEIFYPISKRNFSFPITITTGGFAEQILIIGLMFMIINSYIK